jgi:hypothetical protein
MWGQCCTREKFAFVKGILDEVSSTETRIESFPSANTLSSARRVRATIDERSVSKDESPELAQVVFGTYSPIRRMSQAGENT